MLVLAEFDVRVGNRVVWSQGVDGISGIEYQMIPSGLHDVTSDTIYFCCKKYFGCAVFSARSVQSSGRRSMKVYSLAALAEHTPPFKLETWLRGLLEKFIVVGDVSILESSLPLEPFNDPTAHPILVAGDFIQLYGPMMFEIWKSGLARQKLIIHNSALGVKKLSQICYLVGLISSIPSDVARYLETSEPLEYKCLFNVTLIDTQNLRGQDSYCACTTDSLLVLPDRDICDVVLDTRLHLIDGTAILPTWTDRHRFTANVYRLLPSYTPKASNLLDRFFESAAQGLIWWASAGDTSLVSEEPDYPDLLPQDSMGVVLVGMFHNFTRQLVRTFAALAQEDTIVLGMEDLLHMGLDPISSSDRTFVAQFAKVWFDRKISFKTCCF